MNKKKLIYKAGFYKDFGEQPDLLEIKIGCILIPLVIEEKDKKGPLLGEIERLRNQLDDELGIVLPKFRIRDSIYLEPDEYSILLNGNEVAKSSVKLGYYLCLDTGDVSNPLDTTNWEKIKDPAYEIDGFIIPECDVKKAKEAGYVCAPPEKMIRVHLYEVIRKNITRILNQSMVYELVEKVRKINPDVITDVFFTKGFPVSDMKILLNRLLEEYISIRDMNTILETIADYLNEEQKPLVLAEKVRERLAPGFIKEYAKGKKHLHLFKVSQEVSELISDHIYFPKSKVEKPYLSCDPLDRKRLLKGVLKSCEWFNKHDLIPFFVCVSSIRPYLADFIHKELPRVAVVSDMEVYSVKDIKVTIEGEVEFED